MILLAVFFYILAGIHIIIAMVEIVSPDVPFETWGLTMLLGIGFALMGHAIDIDERLDKIHGEVKKRDKPVSK